MFNDATVLTFPGLFFHVGYSVSDQYLIEGNSRVMFSAWEVTHKFGTLLNSDSAEQVIIRPLCTHG